MKRTILFLGILGLLAGSLFANPTKTFKICVHMGPRADGGPYAEDPYIKELIAYKLMDVDINTYNLTGNFADWCDDLNDPNHELYDEFGHRPQYGTGWPLRGEYRSKNWFTSGMGLIGRHMDWYVTADSFALWEDLADKYANHMYTELVNDGEEKRGFKMYRIMDGDSGYYSNALTRYAANGVEELYDHLAEYDAKLNLPRSDTSRHYAYMWGNLDYPPHYMSNILSWMPRLDAGGPGCYPFSTDPNITSRASLDKIVPSCRKYVPNMQAHNKITMILLQAGQDLGHNQRFPSYTEVRALSWLALAHGNEWLGFYTYRGGAQIIDGSGRLYVTNPEEFNNEFGLDWDDTEGQNNVDFNDESNAWMNLYYTIKEIKKLKDPLGILDWEAGFVLKDEVISGGYCVTSVTGVNYRDIGFYSHPTHSSDYFMVVNHEGVDENQGYENIPSYTLTINVASSYHWLTDLSTLESWYLPHELYSVDIDFEAGQGRLFALWDADDPPEPPIEVLPKPYLGVTWHKVQMPIGPDPEPIQPLMLGTGNCMYWAHLWFGFYPKLEGWTATSYQAYRDALENPPPYGTDLDMEKKWLGFENTCIDDSPLYDPGEEGNWRVVATLEKDGGEVDSESDLVTENAPPCYGSSCPAANVYVGDSLFIQINSLLPHSEFAQAVNVDMLPLGDLPAIFNGHLFLNITEETEITYLDMVKLWAVDHPEGSYVGTDDDGNIMVYSDEVFPSSAYDQNYVDQSDVLNDPTQTYTGVTGEYLEITFPDQDWTNKALMVYAGDLEEYAAVDKQNNALLSVSDTTDTGWIPVGTAYTRQKPAVYLFDVSDYSESVYRMDFTGAGMHINSVALVKLDSGWTQTEAQLDSAVHWYYEAGSWYDVIGTGEVYQTDSLFLVLYSEEQLSLRFDTLRSDTLVRDFVLQTSGFYIPGETQGGGQSSRPVDELVFDLQAQQLQPLTRNVSIRYTIPYQTHVKIAIYDVQGRLVKKLIDAKTSRGIHELVWKGKDDVGRSISAGVYFIRMNAGEFEEHKKIVVLR